MNDKRRVHIDLQSYNGGLESCELRETICQVVVRKTRHPAGLSPEDELSIFQAIGCLPNLQRLDVTNFHPYRFSAANLTVLLENARNLSHLRLDCVEITAANTNDMKELVSALGNLPSLEEVHLVNCVPTHESLTAECLAQGLAKVPSLRVVEIIETRVAEQGGGCWSGISLATLGSSATLQVLRMRGLRFLNDSHMIMLAQQLEMNRTTALHELNIICGIGPGAVHAICRMLRVNTALQMLGLNCVENGELSTDIATSLQQNSTLKVLHLYFREGNVNQIQRQFEGLLATNYVLERIRGGWTNSPIDFYLELNRSGRGALLKDGHARPNEDWIDFIAAQRDAPSTALYLLRQNPSLCRHQD